MHYEQLMALVTLALFGAASTVAAAGVAIGWHRRGAARTERSGVSRARRLFLLRLIPSAAGVLACAVGVLAFLRYEPHGTVEAPGWILVVAASCGISLALAAAGRVLRHWRATRRFLRTMERGAERITLDGVPLPTWQLDTAFPLVALTGVWRPRLLIARCVLEHVPGDELHVIVKHELAHARHRDNLARLLLAALPDVLVPMERWLGLDRAWHDAIEDAADDRAADGDAQARVRLASALVRVARIAGSGPSARVPLLALHRGESVERRVRRLVDGKTPLEPRRSRAAGVTLAVLSAVLVWGAGADVILQDTHRAIEWLVNARP